MVEDISCDTVAVDKIIFAKTPRKLIKMKMTRECSAFSTNDFSCPLAHGIDLEHAASGGSVRLSHLYSYRGEVPGGNHPSVGSDESHCRNGDHGFVGSIHAIVVYGQGGDFCVQFFNVGV